MFSYLVTALIVVIVVIILLGVLVVHHENGPGERPTMTVMRRGNMIVRKVMVGDPCPCGGSVTETGTVSERLGPILGCEGCRRRWAVDGRRIVTTRRPAARRPATRRPATRRRRGPAETPAPVATPAAEPAFADDLPAEPAES